MADDIDIGIGVHASPSDIASADRATQAVRQFSLTAKQAAEILASVGNDWDKFRARVRELKDEFERVGAAATQQSGKVQLFARAADATFTTVPRGARTAANALQTLSLSIESGTGSLSGMVHASGNLAFGLSQLSQNANVVAGAAGFGAIVTVIGIVIELLHNGTASTREQAAAFKELGGSAESLELVSRAVGRLATELGALPGIQSKEFPLVGNTAAAKKAIDELTAATKALRTHDALEQLTGFGGEIARLKDRLISGELSVRQYTDAVAELGRRASASGETFPGLEKLLANATEAGEKFDAATLRLRKANAEAAAKTEDVRVFGPTPEFAKRLDEANRQLNAFSIGGALAARSAEDTQKALDLALKTWDTFTNSEQGAVFAGVRFRDVMDAQSASAKRAGPAAIAAAQSILTASRHIVESERIIAGSPELAESAKKETEKAAQLEIERTKGQAAARRKAADDALLDARRALALESGQASDKNAKLAALEKTHGEEILKINKEEGEKLTNLLAHLTDERLAADAKLSDDEFGVRRAAAEKQHKADLKQITDLKLAGAEDLAARLQAAEAFSSSIQAIEKDRSDKIEDIRIAAQQRIDAVTGKTGDADPAKIRQGYKKQIDLLTATIESADTSGAQKAAAAFGLDLINRSIPLDVAKARMDELEKTLTAATTTGDTAITRTSALLSAHAITEREARQQIVAALTQERGVIAAIIPSLQEQADLLPGNANAQAKLEQYRTKLLEINLTIAQTSDEFFKLKEAGRDAATSAVAGFLEGVAKLGTQSHAEVNALTTDLKSAQKELNGLLAIPASQRTGENNKRISELRAEIESTTVSLDNAKSSITTWRDLFVSALQSIADALIRVSSQMLATALIERILGVVTAGSLSPTGNPLSGGPIGGGGAVNVAEGGLVRGPGTSTSDSIPAWLSNEEYVIRAERVKKFGRAFFDRINFEGEMPPIVLPSRVRRLAAGGLVESASAARFSPASSDPQRIDLVVHSTEDAVIRVMKGPKGRDVTVTHVRGNARQLGISD